jgi:hypothetical protein
VSLHQTSKRTGHIPIGDETDHITIGICCAPCDGAFSHIIRDVRLRVRPHNSAEFNHIGDADSTAAAPRCAAKIPPRGAGARTLDREVALSRGTLRSGVPAPWAIPPIATREASDRGRADLPQAHRPVDVDLGLDLDGRRCDHAGQQVHAPLVSLRLDRLLDPHRVVDRGALHRRARAIV